MTKLEVLLLTAVFHRQMMQRPFPPSHIIMQEASKIFPILTQADLFHLTKIVQSTIKEHEQIAALQNN